MLPSEPVTPLSPARLLGGFGSGAAIGIVGGLIGLGGAEIRLPVLIAFGFDALPAVILNRALSLVVVASALPFRAEAVPYADVAAHGPIILTMLAGSLAGAFAGATYATRFASRTLFRAIAVLLLVTAVLLVAGGDPELRHMPVDGTVRVVAGVAAGFAIGLAVAMMGVAGGELLVPTLVLLFSLPVKLAGSVALVIALPTILVGFARFGRDNTIGVIRDNAPFLGVMVAGSITGTFIGGQLLGILPSVVLLPLLGLILVASAVKIWRHSTRQDHA
ncbi:sulfite exporter TauE/SafE family protein [Xanthobacter dioxanivorans]|uniref:Probable membrane transporter protein n=2 Tax=Xanthobacter dioxanivorans TaxID=2528964 RepID=A0A974PMZ4_9HYPH|nr:sulfite exporter TauE/SafE family protein [Xanthobacter dioxanivorans]